MKKNFTKIFILSLFLTASIYGQSNNLKAQLIDEFGPLGLDELLTRLDNFRNEIYNTADSTGLIKIFGGTNNKYFSFPYTRKAYIKAYLAQFAGSNPNKFIFQNCDITEPEIRMQFIKIPSGTEIEQCEEKFFVPQRTVYFGDGYDYQPNPYEQIVGCCDVAGSGKFVKEESQNLLLRLLKSSPESKIYVIGYAGKFSWEIYKENKIGETIPITKRKTDSLKVAEKLANRTKNSLVEKGIDKSKVIVLNGGYNKDYREVSIYFVPKDGEIPRPKPDYFPNKR